MALVAYRHLLRAAKLAFEGDARVFTAAREQIRSGFRDKAALAPSDPTVLPSVQHAEEVAAFLRSNVVQGKQQEGTTYRTSTSLFLATWVIPNTSSLAFVTSIRH